MKSFLLFVMLIVCFTLPVSAQDNAIGQWFVGFTSSAGIPTSDFKNLTDFGFGGSGWVGRTVGPGVALMGKFGYMHFGGKEYSLLFAGTYLNVKTSFNIMPITGAVRVNLNEGESHVYAMGEAGLYVATANADVQASGSGTSISASGSDTQSKFGVSPTIGAQFKLGETSTVHTHINYTAVFMDGSTLSWIDFGVGLEFQLH